MNIYQFMSDSPYLTFFLALIVAGVIKAAIKYPLRHMSVRSKGWPPAHLDADGDFREQEDKEENKVEVKI